MHREATRSRGAMSAVIGLDIERVEALVRAAAGHGPVSVANHNTAEQIVITGAPGAVQAAAARAKENGARVVPLKVSGAWHSELIAGAVEDFRTFVEAIAFKAADVPILFNVTADTASEADDMRKLMVAQLCSPVRWYAIVQRLAANGMDAFVELGPGRVLTGLVKKSLPADENRRLFNVFDLKSLEIFLKAWT
jgi:[acyl-carrier-protein] S-malonyltransferase